LIRDCGLMTMVNSMVLVLGLENFSNNLIFNFNTRGEAQSLYLCVSGGVFVSIMTVKTLQPLDEKFNGLLPRQDE
jgi:hypothetical protein